MKFKISGKHLTNQDKKILLEFCHYVNSITKVKKCDCTVKINFINESQVRSKKDKEDLNKFLAWITIFERSGNYSITINENTINTNAKKPFTRLQAAMMCIGHELVHVRQYINREMFDYANGDVWYKGLRYKTWQENEDYYFAPWEIEAYGYEQGLFECFKYRNTTK